MAGVAAQPLAYVVRLGKRPFVGARAGGCSRRGGPFFLRQSFRTPPPGRGPHRVNRRTSDAGSRPRRAPGPRVSFDRRAGGYHSSAHRHDGHRRPARARTRVPSAAPDAPSRRRRAAGVKRLALDRRTTAPPASRAPLPGLSPHRGSPPAAEHPKPAPTRARADGSASIGAPAATTAPPTGMTAAGDQPEPVPRDYQRPGCPERAPPRAWPTAQLDRHTRGHHNAAHRHHGRRRPARARAASPPQHLGADGPGKG